ncbi:MAG TPA: hypothetical protein VJM08_03735 [Anaerolineales bacterium]|nr:hypothetical protein [Anaerolineales bacterium]
MNCFYHPGVTAVASCKYCQKGLCTECAVDLKHGMSCKQHQAEVNELYDIHFMHRQSAQNMSRIYKQSAVAMSFMGIAGVVGGLVIGRTGIILVAIGVGCIFLAIAFSIYANRMNKEKNNDA